MNSSRDDIPELLLSDENERVRSCALLTPGGGDTVPDDFCVRSIDSNSKTRLTRAWNPSFVNSKVVAILYKELRIRGVYMKMFVIYMKICELLYL